MARRSIMMRGKRHPAITTVVGVCMRWLKLLPPQMLAHDPDYSLCVLAFYTTSLHCGRCNPLGYSSCVLAFCTNSTLLFHFKFQPSLFFRFWLFKFKPHGILCSVQHVIPCRIFFVICCCRCTSNECHGSIRIRSHWVSLSNIHLLLYTRHFMYPSLSSAPVLSSGRRWRR